MSNRNKVAIVIVLLCILAVSAFALTKYFSKPIVDEKLTIIKRDMERGVLWNICDIESQYYSNPDFYPTWIKYKDDYISGHIYTRWGVSGYGAMPSQIGIGGKPMYAGQSFSTCTFVHTSWEVETYQGIRLEMDYDKTLFDVQITPQDFLLSPTFPEFVDAWAEKIRFNVTAKQDIPAGTYNFKLKGLMPSDELNKEYYTNVVNMAEFKWYNCPFGKVCDDKVVELRKRTYIAGSPMGISADKFYSIELLVTNPPVSVTEPVGEIVINE